MEQLVDLGSVDDDRRHEAVRDLLPRLYGPGEGRLGDQFGQSSMVGSTAFEDSRLIIGGVDAASNSVDRIRH